MKVPKHIHTSTLTWIQLDIFSENPSTTFTTRSSRRMEQLQQMLVNIRFFQASETLFCCFKFVTFFGPSSLL